MSRCRSKRRVEEKKRRMLSVVSVARYRVPTLFGILVGTSYRALEAVTSHQDNTGSKDRNGRFVGLEKKILTNV